MSRFLKYTDEQKQKALELRKSGLSLEQIEKETGVSTGSIRSWCNKEGITLSKDQRNQNLKHEDLLGKEQQVIELRKNGVAIPVICEKLGVSRSYVKRLQFKLNIKIDKEIKINNAIAGRSKYLDVAKNNFLKIIEENQGLLLCEYSNYKEDVKIKCKENHIFIINPGCVVNNNQWCKECFIDKMTGPNSPIAQKKLKELGYNNHLEWCQAVAAERGGKCLAIESVVTHEKVKWECDKGHVWECSLNTIISCDSWCPICAPHGPSRGQLEVAEYIKELVGETGVIIDDYSVLTTSNIDNSSYKRALELDIYVPYKRFALEYNGLYYHSDAFKELRSGKEMVKALTCHKLGIKFLMIYEDEWRDKQDLVKAMIRQRLNCFNGERIYARNLELRYLDKNKDWEGFFDRNHLDGSVNASWGYGLFKGNKLLMCANIRHNFNNEIELARMATDYNYLIPGGASKIMKAIKEKLGDIKLITFSNNRLSSGDVYKKMNAELISSNKPSYYYTDGNSRIWRFKCRRINDPIILNKYPSEKAQALGGVFSQKIFGDNRPLYKIEDAGHQKWVI